MFAKQTANRSAEACVLGKVSGVPDDVNKHLALNASLCGRRDERRHC